ncbi:hypothetical protein DRH27_04840, partial [Candidatus Falkowbacteria bacterium]
MGFSLKKIYKLFIIAILVVGCFFVLIKPWESKAQNTALLNFTGKVTNTDGTEVADGNYDFVFRLYDAPTGGSQQWTETLSSSTRFSGAIAGVASSSDGIIYTYSGASATSTFQIGQYLTNASTS